MYRLVVVLVLSSTVTLLTACAHSQEEKPWNRVLSPEQIRSDFEDLYAGLQSGHVNLYANKPKTAYDALYAEKYKSFSQPLRLFDVQVAFQKFTAFGNVAHANIPFPREAYTDYRQMGGRAFPIYPIIVNGKTYVGENYSGIEAVHIGDEIVSLNGLSMSDWLTKLSTHISADSPEIAHSILEFSLPQYLWLELRSTQAFTVRLKSKANKYYTVAVPATTQEQQTGQANSMSSQPSIDAYAPTSNMLTDNIAYLRPGPFYNAKRPEQLWDNSAFKVFIDTAFTSFLEAQAETLIIDLRQNPGGDNSFSDLMLAWFATDKFRFCSAFRVRSSDEAAASNQARLDSNPDATESVSNLFAMEYERTPRGELFNFDIDYVQPREGERFTGDVYVMINRHSYSNAVTVAATVQDFGFATVVGEKTSDLATTYGAMETFELPISNIKVGFPKAHIIRPSGVLSPDGVTPGWLIPSPIVKTQGDQVLDALLEKLQR